MIIYFPVLFCTDSVRNILIVLHDRSITGQSPLYKRIRGSEKKMADDDGKFDVQSFNSWCVLFIWNLKANFAWSDAS